MVFFRSIGIIVRPSLNLKPVACHRILVPFERSYHRLSTSNLLSQLTCASYFHNSARLAQKTMERPKTHIHSIRTFSTSTITKNASTESKEAKSKKEESKSNSEPIPDTKSVEVKSGEWRDVWRLLLLAKHDWKLFSFAIALLLVAVTISMIFPKVIGQIFDSLKDKTIEDDVKILGLSLQNFIFALSGVLVVFTVTHFGRTILLKIIGERIVARLRSKLVRKIMGQDQEFFDINKVGDLISRATNDAYIVSRSINQNLSDGLKHVLVFVTSVVFMYSISPTLTLYVSICSPPLFVYSYFYGKRIRQISKGIQEATANLTKVNEEQLNAIKTVQSFAAEIKETHKYNDKVRKVFQLSKTEALTNGLFLSGTSSLGDISFLIILGFGIHSILTGTLTVGDLTAFLLYSEKAGPALYGLSSFYSDIMKGAGAATRLFELIDRIPEIKPTVGQPIESSRGEITFENVTFAYPTRPNNKIFDECSFTIPAGSNVCIVGPSGRGKSTITSLLLRFYNPTGGRILIDGEDITKYNVKSLRRLMGVVQQEPILLSGSIRKNITYGLKDNEEPTYEDIKFIAERANCHFIENFPDKYDTIIGPRGALLSGGQKQRVAIARALMKKPAILILDEATSALDSKSEAAINSTLLGLMRDDNLTTISIAHRLSTIERADIVIVLGYNGKVAEMGNFNDLYGDKSSALYKLLHEDKIEKPASEDLEKDESGDDAVEADMTLMMKEKQIENRQEI